jgi:hypothetical protein
MPRRAKFRPVFAELSGLQDVQERTGPYLVWCMWARVSACCVSSQESASPLDKNRIGVRIQALIGWRTKQPTFGTEDLQTHLISVSSPLFCKLQNPSCPSLSFPIRTPVYTFL